ncbi:MAG: hypothetical protein HY892_20465 [Deltaproteobacteria bacterium]|nr:hypothetical protein [Deltaproteobacteria bacterium]
MEIMLLALPKNRVLCGLLFMAIALMGPGCRGTGLDLKDVPGLLSKKLEVLSRMRIDLLKSVAAEKSAVMADTDEASQTFADQALQAAQRVEQGRREMQGLVDRDHTDAELKLLQEFDGAWAEFVKIDRETLDFAVQNTNLKAARLSFGPGAEAMQLLEKTINRLASRQPQFAGATCRILTGGWKILYLHAPHVAAAEDNRMDEIEAAIRRQRAEMAGSLQTLRSRIPPEKQADLAEAEEAFDELQKVTARVIELSRKNTNIKSFEISLGRKRKISARCDELLTALQETVRGREFKATR